jgi:hypothetical protein
MITYLTSQNRSERFLPPYTNARDSHMGSSLTLDNCTTLLPEGNSDFVLNKLLRHSTLQHMTWTTGSESFNGVTQDSHLIEPRTKGTHKPSPNVIRQTCLIAPEHPFR